MTEIILMAMFLGGIAGVLSGLFGIGGGIVLVPFLAWMLHRHGIPEELVMIMAVSTSLATIILTATASALAHNRRGSLPLPLLLRFVPGLIAGTILGSLLADALPGQILRIVFGVFLFSSSVQMMLDLRPAREAEKDPGTGILVTASTVIGMLSSILGIGGGTLTVPFLLRHGLPITRAVAISSACGIPIALPGSISYALLGSRATGLPPFSLGYIYLPAFLAIILVSPLGAQLGVRLAHSLPAARIKKVFAGLLLVVGLRLLWQF